MVLEFVYMVLGPWSRVAIPWLAARPVLLAAIFVGWCILFWASKLQLKRSESYLQKATLDLARDWQRQGREIDPARLFEQVLREWNPQLHKLAWFIPNRLEIWPIPATMDNVKSRIGFSPEWVQNILVQNHFLPD